MRENVPLLKCNHLRSGSRAIQRELRRLKRGARMLLSNGDLRAGSTNTGCGDGVLPGCRHLRRRAEAPDGAVQWPLLKKEDRPGHWPKEPVQFGVVLDLALQDVRIRVWPRGSYRRAQVRGRSLPGSGGTCRREDRLRVFIDAPRRSAQRDQQAQGKHKPVPRVLHSHVSMVGTPSVQNNHHADWDAGRERTDQRSPGASGQVFLQKRAVFDGGSLVELSARLCEFQVQ